MEAFILSLLVFLGWIFVIGTMLVIAFWVVSGIGLFFLALLGKLLEEIGEFLLDILRLSLLLFTTLKKLFRN